MQLEVGAILDGKVTGITNFGVFVDIGEGKTGMVHISEVAQSYVSEIRDHIKEQQEVKVKVMTIGDDGKISLSIKRAMDKPKVKAPRKPAGIDKSFEWSAKNSDAGSFEEMMNKFKQTSEDKFSDLKRKNGATKRPKRGGGAASGSDN